MGQSPFSATAASARLLTERFALADLAVRLGRADLPVSIDAARLEGNYSGAGTFSGGSATLGRVPLLLSEASGDWRMRDGGVSISGGMLIAHRHDPPNFYPLRSNDMNFVLADGRIRSTGSLHHPASGTKVTDATIQHDLDTGSGTAVLDVPGLNFGPGLQPEELTRLTEGVVALVQGRLTGQGRIAWTGSGEVTSTGEFTAHDMDLAASFGPITGMTGTIRFTDLLGLQTAPGAASFFGKHQLRHSRRKWGASLPVAAR